MHTPPSGSSSYGGGTASKHSRIRVVCLLVLLFVSVSQVPYLKPIMTSRLIESNFILKLEKVDISMLSKCGKYLCNLLFLFFFFFFLVFLIIILSSFPTMLIEN